VAESSEAYASQIFEDFDGSESVESGVALRHVAVHGIGLAGASLPIGEASDLGPLESRLDQRPHSQIIDLDESLSTYWFYVC